jgi:hypothetical protein
LSINDLINNCVEEEESLETEKMKDVGNMVGNLSLNGMPKNQHESDSSKQGKRKHPKKNGNKSVGPRTTLSSSVPIRKRMAKCSTLLQITSAPVEGMSRLYEMVKNQW